MNIRNTLSLLLIPLFLTVSGQEHENLLKRKENLIQEVNVLNNLLLETRSSHTNSLESLAVLNKQIKLKESLLDIINEEFKILESQEKKLQKDLEKLVNELVLLKKNYARLISFTHKSIRGYNKLLFFLSSANFNELLRRAYHFRQLEINRRSKYIEIDNLQKAVFKSKKQINDKKAIKSDLTFTKNKELDLLNNTKIFQQDIIGSLKSKEDSLVQVIKIKESETKKITSEILAILERKENKSSNLTPELKLISTNFSSNKGRLPWPVLSGSVISQFGQIPHPVLSGIKIMNNGVEISTKNTEVRSVFNGEISKIIVLPTGLKVVIIKHGDYLTVYSNLSIVNFEKGAKVKTKDNIGTIYVDKNKSYQTLGFQIWKAREKLNPMHWISSR